MHSWQGSWPAWLLAAVGAGLLVLSLVSWRRRVLPTARRLAILFVAAAVWAIADGLGSAVTTLGAKIALTKVETLAALAVVSGWLLVVRAFTGRSALRPSHRVLLLLAPAVLAPFIVGNWDALVWSSVTLVRTPAGLQGDYVYGPLMWVEVAYACLLGAIGVVWLLPALRSGEPAHRRQAFVVAAVALLPFIGTAIDFSSWRPFVQDIDVTPLAFAPGIVLLGWSLLREGFLEVAPLARDALLRTLPDTVLVVDHERRLTEANPAAAAILGLGDGDVPCQLDEALAAWPPLLAACAPLAEAREVLLARADGERRYEVRSTALRDVAGREPRPPLRAGRRRRARAARLRRRPLPRPERPERRTSAGRASAGGGAGPRLGARGARRGGLSR
jgi:PAS domain-containing protein